MERVSQRLGRLILGDRQNQFATGADRESTGVSAGMGERQAPQPFENGPRGFGPHSHDGVPVAERPRHPENACVPTFAKVAGSVREVRPLQ